MLNVTVTIMLFDEIEYNNIDRLHSKLLNPITILNLFFIMMYVD